MAWRPDGIENEIERGALLQVCPYSMKPVTPYEINAVRAYVSFGMRCVDATLESLREEGKSDLQACWDRKLLESCGLDVKGTLVFIPD